MAPAPAAAGRQADHVPAAQDVAVRHRREPALVGPARVDDAGAGAARVATVDAGGREQDVVLADGDDGLVRQQLQLADHAGATAEAPGAARVLVERVLAQAQREHHLHELGRVVLLGHVVDRVEAVGERPRSIAHGDAVAAQEELVAHPIESPEEVDVVDRVRGGDVAVGGQRQQGEHVRLHARQGVGAVAERGRPVRLQDAARPHQHLVDGVLGPVVEQHRGVSGQQVDAHDQLGDALVHDEVDRPARLVVALPRVEADPATLLGQAHAHVEGAAAHAVAVHRVLTLVGAVGDARLQRLADGVAALRLEERPGGQHRLRTEAIEQLQDAALA